MLLTIPKSIFNICNFCISIIGEYENMWRWDFSNFDVWKTDNEKNNYATNTCTLNIIQCSFLDSVASHLSKPFSYRFD